VIQAAIAKEFHTFALTEHIPRPFEDFYPEEVCLPYRSACVTIS
jgi:histidinol phosphatase-like PHP family hydrolase